jgi:hypothetical protein
MLNKFTIIMISILIASCSDNRIVSNPITGKKPNPGIFSKDVEKGISFDAILNSRDNDGINANVNGYLWRASLDVLSIAPLISTDALGGTIITDWYINKNILNQRIKITAFIKTSELRSEGIEIKVHLQEKKNNIWSDTMRNKSLETQIENQILNEARILRINSLK